MNDETRDILKTYYCRSLSWFQEGLNPELNYAIMQSASPIRIPEIATNLFNPIKNFMNRMGVGVVDQASEYLDNLDKGIACARNPWVYETFKYAVHLDYPWMRRIIDERGPNTDTLLANLKEGTEEISHPTRCYHGNVYTRTFRDILSK